ncbi:Gfo/Idh/MocA family protein [Streptomyces griseoloalbus]|uniref:Putative dehydrogenase n=1 Tax=Streptomyces griseoloalbus TaxID=67303 RepID=A0A7W8BN44_9ACTN|nr:Gfo/Idh/MocA family oxidoreductase [Streptomyces albaduncus]MBB5125648.1 putative dehydrogenase [Streptomyces albaduncus]GGW56279.1 oxidoreductase [Streptomyces albaduncus]
MTDTGREPLRIGILGAARITERSLIAPARAGGHRLVAVAARDRSRAETFAAAHGVERTLGSYAALLADPEVDVVYNPLANGLHGPWNVAALAAGKHVLTEKPSASNAREAEEVREAAARSGTVFMEAFHYLFHPVTRRLHELLASGELGELRHAEAMVATPAPQDTDPRWSLALAGGALMDLGCYSLHALRMLAPWAGGAPRLLAARAGERRGASGVDEWLDAELGFPGGATGTARCHMAYDRLEMSIRVVGSRGEATAPNFVLPHRDDRVVVRTADGERTEHLGTRSSYTYQLEAFAARVREAAPLALGTDDAVTTMRLIDACYEAAGFAPRPRTRLGG